MCQPSQADKNVVLLCCFDQNERLKKENVSLRWRLAMAGDRKQKAEKEEGVQDLNYLLASKEVKIRALEDQVSYRKNTSRHDTTKETGVQFSSMSYSSNVRRVRGNLFILDGGNRLYVFIKASLASCIRSGTRTNVI